MEGGAGAGMRIALGIEDYLDDFALRHSALTWKQLAKDHPQNWKSIFLGLTDDSVVVVLFNLDGVDVWRGVTRAAAKGKGLTD